MKRSVTIMLRARKGANPLNRFDAVKTGYPEALNSIYINDGFLPQSDTVRVTIEDMNHDDTRKD